MPPGSPAYTDIPDDNEEDGGPSPVLQTPTTLYNFTPPTNSYSAHMGSNHSYANAQFAQPNAIAGSSRQPLNRDRQYVGIMEPRESFRSQEHGASSSRSQVVHNDQRPLDDAERAVLSKLGDDASRKLFLALLNH